MLEHVCAELKRVVITTGVCVCVCVNTMYIGVSSVLFSAEMFLGR